MLTWLLEAKRCTLCLIQTPKRATVRGYLHQGQRPHINFHGVRYSSATLASTAAFLGKSLHIYYHSDDLRTVRAFAADGAEIGTLKAQGAWGEIAHDLKLRQEVLRLRGRKRLGTPCPSSSCSRSSRTSWPRPSARDVRPATWRRPSRRWPPHRQAFMPSRRR